MACTISCEQAPGLRNDVDLPRVCMNPVYHLGANKQAGSGMLTLLCFGLQIHALFEYLLDMHRASKAVGRIPAFRLEQIQHIQPAQQSGRRLDTSSAGSVGGQFEPEDSCRLLGEDRGWNR